MAGPLTWRNVDSPDFRGVARGYEASAALLGNAFDSASKGLAAFQADRQNTTDTGVLSGLLKINDPKAYQDAVNNTDLTGVSKQGLAAIGSRAGQLLQQAATGQKMQFDQYDQTRKVLGDTRKDAAIPGTSEYLQAAAVGDEETMQNLLRTNPGLRQLDIDDQQKLVSSGKAGTQGFRSGRDADQAYFNTQQDRGEGRAAQALAVKVKSGTRPDDLVGQMAALEQSGASPQVIAQATKYLAQDPYGIPRATGGGGKASSAIGSASGLGAAASGDFATNIPFDETRKYVSNITSKAGEVTGTNAEKAAKLLPFLVDQESGGDNNAVSPKGARGSTQVMPATGTDPGYGVKPLANQSPEEYRRFGQDYLTAMLDKYDGDVPKALAAYNAGPGTVDQWTAGSTGNKFGENADDVAAQPITRGEVDSALATLGDNQMSNNAGRAGAQEYLANATNKANTVDVISDLVKTSFPDADRGKVTGLINDMINQSGGRMNPAQAAAIIKQNPAKAGWFDFGTTNLGEGYGVNDNGIQGAVAAARNGSTVNQAMAAQADDQIGAVLKSSYEAAQTAQANLAQLQADIAAGRSGLANQLPRLQAAANKAQEKLQLALDNQRAAKRKPIVDNTPPEQKNRDMNVPDPKSIAQTVNNRLAALPDDFGLYD